MHVFSRGSNKAVIDTFSRGQSVTLPVSGDQTRLAA